MSTHPFQSDDLKYRHLKSFVFKNMMRCSVLIALLCLLFFLFDIVSKALPAFKQTYVYVDISYTERAKRRGDFAVDKNIRKLVSRSSLRLIPQKLKENPELIGTTEKIWVLADDQVDQFMKGHHANLSKKLQSQLLELKSEGWVEVRFNRIFFSRGDSKIPEYAGLKSALMGSALTLLVTLFIAFPIGLLTAIYLEEFAKENVFTQFVEVNINNLAAIPSILFGLLGLSIFINVFGMPRGSPLVGGLTLALMTLPIIIVSSRAALRSIPDSIRQAAYGLGLTKVQVVRDHVLPLAMPGVMTGSIVGIAQAMGETAPLIMIGMVAFIPDSPNSLLDAATVLPAQVFTWAGMPERAYVEKTAAGILVILGLLTFINSFAIYLRKKYEIKW